MARINSIGMDELLDRIVLEEKTLPQTLEKMLEACAEVYVEETKAQIKNYRIFDLGTTHLSIKKRYVGKRGDELRMEVWPAGTRRDKNHPKGERVETVAFVAQYGTRSRPARPFMTAAAAAAEDKGNRAMLEVWERETKL